MKQITLLPADTYKVINKTILTDYDKKVIINLYQPIIGPIAVSLYLTLISDLNSELNFGIEHTHHHLMIVLKSGLDVIKQARTSLESVGLVKTLVKVEENINQYIYEIYSPISPNEFFNHPILNIILYNNIGDKEYDNLVKLYKKNKLDTKDYNDVSSTLNNTYVSISNLNKGEEIVNKEVLGVNVGESIDFDLIISSIPKNIISDKAFNKKCRELINNLAFVYDIDNLRMIDLIRLSIDENGMINKEKLIVNVRKYYDFNNNGNLPTLIYRTQPEYLKQKYNDNSNRGKMLYVFENTSPYDFLMGKNKGVKPTNRDLKLLEYLAVELKMKPAVINVLIDYVLRINDNKLNRNYVEAIASQWIRSNIETASSAMERAEKEHKKNKTKVFTATNKENVPVWFNEKIEKLETSEEEKKELEELLKDFR
ncbi:MAG: DnaD domain protein [Bacilli bacterium]|nr:DnaD domain protein [Bacilli bacterium]